MQMYPTQILININHDYMVVINIHNVIIQHNVKLDSTFEHGDQAITHLMRPILLCIPSTSAA
jgi:hypothetical protein